jgi:hypothetical protein
MFFDLIITLLCFLLVALLLRKPIKRKNVPFEVEDHVIEVLANLDSWEKLDDNNHSSRGAYQAKIIALAKAEFGLLKRTEANRLMVRKFLRDQMRDRKMRPTHIAAHLDISVSCFFIPSKADLIAH